MAYINQFELVRSHWSLCELSATLVDFRLIYCLSYTSALYLYPVMGMVRSLYNCIYQQYPLAYKQSMLCYLSISFLYLFSTSFCLFIVVWWSNIGEPHTYCLYLFSTSFCLFIVVWLSNIGEPHTYCVQTSVIEFVPRVQNQSKITR